MRPTESAGRAGERKLTGRVEYAGSVIVFFSRLRFDGCGCVEAIEWKTAFANLPAAIQHPRWFIDFARGGRKRLLASVVRDSIDTVRRSSGPRSLDALLTFGPVSVIGKMGAPQELLYYIVRLCRPLRCVETGVYRGISTAFILAALEDNGCGHLTSIDLPAASYVDPMTAQVYTSPLLEGEEPGFAVPKSLRDRWTLVLGDSRALLPKVLSEIGKIDMFLHDSAHTYDVMKWELETAAQHMARDGIMLSDDTQWNNAFAEFCSSKTVVWKGIAAGRLGIARLR